jgi:hypothetical protein
MTSICLVTLAPMPRGAYAHQYEGLFLGKFDEVADSRRRRRQPADDYQALGWGRQVCGEFQSTNRGRKLMQGLTTWQLTASPGQE